MKRRIATILALAALAGAAAACSKGEERPADVPGAAANGWTQPPTIRTVERRADGLSVLGQADPGARVVLRSGDGAAYAAVADARGGFDIRMAPPAGHALLQPEIQVGQDAVPSPDRLLIVAGGEGPIALVRAGGPTRRLDRASALGAIDSDGRAMLASGGAVRGRVPPPVRLGAGSPVRAVLEGGRWTALLGASPGGAATVTVGATAYAWPGEAPRAGGLSVERAGAGWRVGWPGPAGAWQTAWLPDPAA